MVTGLCAAGWHASMRRAWRVAACVVSVVGGHAAEAQSARLVAAAPMQLALDGISERRFDAASGLRAPTVYDLAIDRTGVPWIGAEDGPYRFDGSVWRRDSLPAGLQEQQVRDILFAADGSRWYATRRGAVRCGPDGRLTFFTEREGLVGPVVFGLAETRAIDGTPRVVAGTSRGVSWFDGERFVPLAMPLGAEPRGAMVAGRYPFHNLLTLRPMGPRSCGSRMPQQAWRAFGSGDGRCLAVRKGWRQRASNSCSPSMNTPLSGSMSRARVGCSRCNRSRGRTALYGFRVLRRALFDWRRFQSRGQAGSCGWGRRMDSSIGGVAARGW